MGTLNSLFPPCSDWYYLFQGADCPADSVSNAWLYRPTCHSIPHPF